MDQETDKENKPGMIVVGKDISEGMAYNIYVGLNVIGVGIGFYLSNVVEKPSFAAIFIVIAATLYLYATSLKQMLLVGNIIVALLLSVSVLIIGVFDLLPATFDGNQYEMRVMFSILIDYAIFAFIINLIREIVKDMEDVNGDYNQGMSTLPIALGIGRTAKVTFGLLAIAILVLLFYINTNLMDSNLYIATIYALILVVGPLFFCLIKIWSAKTKKEFKLISNVLKLVIFFGILSILVINLNIIYNA